MHFYQSDQHKRKGFLLLESLLAVAILGILIVSIFPTVSFMFKRMRRTKYDAQASLLLQEGIEIAYNVFTARTDWSGLTVGTYRPVRVGAAQSWNLEIGTELPLETRFTRTIQVLPVCRDASYNRKDVCTATDTIETDSRIVRARISWDEPGAEPIQAELLLTQFNRSN